MDVWNEKTKARAYAYIEIKKPKIEVTRTNHDIGSYSNLKFPSFFSSETGNSYFIQDAKENSSDIDFVFFKGKKNKYTIASPNDNATGTVYNNTKGLGTWQNLNQTKFTRTNITTEEFATITAETIKEKSKHHTESKITQLHSGEVIAFTTQSGKTGILKITYEEGSTTAIVVVKTISKI